MRVIFAQHLTYDPGGFLMSRVGTDAHVVHGVQDAPVDRLQAVTRVRQGPGYDHAHGVIQIGGAHLLVDIDGLN